MSAAQRPNRSQLSVPAVSMKFMEKAAASAADVVFLDLEDSVAAEDKATARANAAQAIQAFDWGAKTLSVRVNAWDTPWTLRDLTAILEGGAERLDMVMLPKVHGPADVHALDLAVAQLEREAGRTRPLGLELLIESAAGIAAIDAIVAASDRTEAVHFGPGDYAASVGARTTAIGEQDPAYPGDIWHYPLSRLLVAGRSRDLRVVDGPWSRYADLEGLETAARRAAALGFDGKWAIHPSQIETLNTVFSLSPAEIDQARRILAAMDEAAVAGRGAATLDGRMIDVASIRQAQALVDRSRRIGLA